DEAEDDRLAVGDRRGEDHPVRSTGRSPGPSPAGCRFPVWNQAKTSSATPTRNDAIPCLTWWWPEPVSRPGMNDGSEPAGPARYTTASTINAIPTTTAAPTTTG